MISIKYIFAITSISLAFNCYATTDKIVAELHANKDYIGACDRAIKLAREGTGHDAYYFAAICKDRYDSTGVSNDEYIKWLNIASNNGDHGASYRLGQLFETSDYVSADPVRSLEFYRTAKRQSDKESFIPIVMEKIEYLEKQTDCAKRTTVIFNTEIKCSTRNDLDSALIAAGGTPKEHKENESVYLSHDLLKDSETLTIYYTEDGDFACLQYSFYNFSKVGNRIAEELTGKIVDKYGKSDDGLTSYRRNARHFWTLNDGITVKIIPNNIETHLRFCHPIYEKIMLSERYISAQETLHKERITEDEAY